MSAAGHRRQHLLRAAAPALLIALSSHSCVASPAAAWLWTALLPTATLAEAPTPEPLPVGSLLAANQEAGPGAEVVVDLWPGDRALAPVLPGKPGLEERAVALVPLGQGPRGEPTDARGGHDPTRLLLLLLSYGLIVLMQNRSRAVP